MRINVVVVDDHAIVREGLQLLLQNDPDINVIGSYATGLEAVQQIQKLKPDIAIMDISMPDMDGIEATSRIAEMGLPTKVIILSMYGNAEHIQRALHAGATGYLLKHSAGKEVIKAVKAVHAGGRYLSEKIADVVFDDYVGNIKHKEFAKVLDKLSNRECEVLKLLAEGKSSASIGKMINLSKKTVETYKCRIMHKLNVTDFPALIKIAIQSGLVSID
jgi:DNA-binding NarL/FixJ family response regulator